MIKRGIFIGVAALFFFSSLAWGRAVGSEDFQPRLRFQSSASVDGEEIRLGHIAQVQAPGFARQMLENISLGRSPKPGRVKTIAKRQILSCLRPHQDLIQDMGVDIPEQIYVKRNSQKFTEKQIRFYLEDYMARAYKNKEIALDRLEIPESEQYPMGEITVAAAGPLRVNRDGRFSFSLEVFVGGQREDRIRVAGRLAVYDTVPVASRRLSRGDVLSPDQVEFIRKNIVSLHGETPGRLDGLSDKALTRDIKRGEVVRSDWLKPVPLIRKGQVVTLLAQKDSIVIRTAGVSREDGLRDDLIEVENVRSGKLVRGLVRRAAVVEVIY